MGRHVALVALAACSSPAPAPPVVHAPAPVVVAADASVDAGIDQDATLAAIQKAMNDLDPAARKCWAAAAAERFDVEGNFEARIQIEPIQVVVVTDTTNNKTLRACMVAVLQAYAWAPPLHGQTIQLPFKFRAPERRPERDRSRARAGARAGDRSRSPCCSTRTTTTTTPPRCSR